MIKIIIFHLLIFVDSKHDVGSDYDSNFDDTTSFLNNLGKAYQCLLNNCIEVTIAYESQKRILVC